jgi:hypothetical protein
MAMEKANERRSLRAAINPDLVLKWRSSYARMQQGERVDPFTHRDLTSSLFEDACRALIALVPSARNICFDFDRAAHDFSVSHEDARGVHIFRARSDGKLFKAEVIAFGTRLTLVHGGKS